MLQYARRRSALKRGIILQVYDLQGNKAPWPKTHFCSRWTHEEGGQGIYRCYYPESIAMSAPSNKLACGRSGCVYQGIGRSELSSLVYD